MLLTDLALEYRTELFSRVTGSFLIWLNTDPTREVAHIEAKTALIT